MSWPWSCLFSSSMSRRTSASKGRLKFLRRGEKPTSLLTKLGDLPDCLFKDILCRLKPADVARLACVNHSFQAAAYSDCVWLKMLPSSYAEILAQASDVPANICSMKEVYDFLCKGVLIQDCTRAFWLDRETGAVCQSIGARGLVTDGPGGWLHDPPVRGSRFTEVANITRTTRRLLLFEGIPGCSLSPGTYVLSWRLFWRAGRNPGEDRSSSIQRTGPVSFYFEATGNVPVDVECHMSRLVWPLRLWQLRTSVDQQPNVGFRVYPDEWIEHDLGKFNVESEGSQIKIKFSMPAYLDLDCVMIRPSFLIPPSYPCNVHVLGHNLADRQGC